MPEFTDRRVGGRRAADVERQPTEEMIADFGRMRASLIELWSDLATGSEGAWAGEVDGACASIFPDPRAAVFNNALIDRGCVDPAVVLGELRRRYEDAGIERFAIWAHETEDAACRALGDAGLELSESTRAMLLHLDHLPPPKRARGSRGSLSIGTTLAPGEALELNSLPLDTLDAWPDDAIWYLALEDEAVVSCALALDRGGDRSISFVATREGKRRQGAARRVLARILSDARAAGCTTASLHATPAAEPLYRRAGFGDLGRLLEFRPAA